MQTKGEYTPGPWLLMNRTIYALDETGITNRFSASVSAGWLVNNREPPSPAEMDANARLIAAAPELLEACNSMIPSGVCLTNKNVPDGFTVALDCTMGDLRAVAAAIAKAKGLPS